MSDSGDLLFDISLPIKSNKEGHMILHGPIVQGTPKERFVYLDIGAYAGQENTTISGRLKVPLPEIIEDVAQAARDEYLLMTTISGTKGKDGRPNMGTVKPFSGWKIEKL